MSSYLRALSASVSLLALLVSSPALSNSYADLSAMDKDYVERLCAPIQYKQDVSAYRDCVAEQSAAVHKYNRTPISSLDFDEQYSVQQICQNEGAIGSTSYRQCVVLQARSLQGTQPADVSSLSDEQIYVAKQNCADSTQGVKPYRLCLSNAVVALKDPTARKSTVTAEAPKAPLLNKKSAAVTVQPPTSTSPASIPETVAVELPANTIPTNQSANVAVEGPTTALPDKNEVSTANQLVEKLPTTEAALESNTAGNPTPNVQSNDQSVLIATEPDEQIIDQVVAEKSPKPIQQTELATSTLENQTNDQLAIKITPPIALPDVSKPAETITQVPTFVDQAINQPELAATTPDDSTLEPLTIEVPALVSRAIKQAMPSTTATDDVIPAAGNTQSVVATSDEIQNAADSSTSDMPTTLAIQVGSRSTRLPSEISTNVESGDNTTQITPPPVQSAQLVEETLTPQLSAAESVSTNAQDATPNAQEPANTDDLDPVNSQKPPLDVAKDTAQRLWDQLQASLEGVQGMDRIILLCALALPFLLIGFWLIMRRSSDNSDSYEPHHSESSAGGSRGNTAYSMHDDTADTSNDTLDAKQVQYKDQVEELFADDEDPVFTDTASNDIPEERAYIDIAETANEDTYQAAPSSALAAILVDAEKVDQLGLVIEFMIYWMAFTDERYEPELKRKIFSIEEPDEHDLIKRCVLNHDVNAFADATSWLQENASKEERLQILKLLMALLVYEEGVTPVQNTLLRFLSNTFGFTHIQLDGLFQKAFGHELPPMPRPDKPTWWNKQSSDKLKRWDARSVAMQTPAIQARVKLGLPLTGDIDPQQISERHERAILRCQAENFDLLTTREQQLAESQQAKYHNALDTLVEITE